MINNISIPAIVLGCLKNICVKNRQNKMIRQACHCCASMVILNLIELKTNQTISLPETAHFVL